ncbi:MAG: hypothetical protein ACREIW_08855, partial [Chthoniobacterales bacterium]
MLNDDFDLKAVYDAIDALRDARGMTWAAVARELNRSQASTRSIAASTIVGLKKRAVAEGDGVLQMLIWIGRTPESFVPAFPNADGPRFQLTRPPAGQVLR